MKEGACVCISIKDNNINVCTGVGKETGRLPRVLAGTVVWVNDTH